MKIITCAFLGLTLMSSITHAKTCMLTITNQDTSDKKSMVLEAQPGNRSVLILGGELENFKTTYISSFPERSESITIISEDGDLAETKSAQGTNPLLNVSLTKNNLKAYVTCENK